MGDGTTSIILEEFNKNPVRLDDMCASGQIVFAIVGIINITMIAVFLYLMFLR